MWIVDLVLHSRASACKFLDDAGITYRTSALSPFLTLAEDDYRRVEDVLSRWADRVQGSRWGWDW